MVHQGGPRNPYHPGRRAPGRPVHPGPSRIILLPSECGPDLDAVASQTPHYVQVVGFIDQVKIDMLPDDYGGEMVSQNLLFRAMIGMLLLTTHLNNRIRTVCHC